LAILSRTFVAMSKTISSLIGCFKMLLFGRCPDDRDGAIAVLRDTESSR
jgi:hypothetical protein